MDKDLTYIHGNIPRTAPGKNIVPRYLSSTVMDCSFQQPRSHDPQIAQKVAISKQWVDNLEL